MKWIDVNERLPAPHVDVLVWCISCCAMGIGSMSLSEMWNINAEERAKAWAEPILGSHTKQFAINAYIAGAQSTQPEQTTLQVELSKMSYGDLAELLNDLGDWLKRDNTSDWRYNLFNAIDTELFTRIQHLIQLTKS